MKYPAEVTLKIINQIRTMSQKQIDNLAKVAGIPSVKKEYLQEPIEIEFKGVTEYNEIPV